MKRWRPAGMPMHDYDRYQWHEGSGGLYESNYLKANSPDGSRALWLKHNILSPAKKGERSIVELWGVLFVRGKMPRVVKQEIPTTAVRLGQDSLRMEGEGILLSPTRTATTIRDGKHRVSWDIVMQPVEGVGDAPILHFPYASMYTLPFPKKKVLTPAPKMRWDGVFRWDDEEIKIEGWTGFRGHNWGTEHAWRYAYGNCNEFAEDPRLVVDAFSAKIRLGFLKSPYLSAAIVREGDQDIPFNRLGSIVGARAVLRFPRWELFIKGEDAELEWVQEGVALDFVGLPYIHPNGKVSYCYNTKWAKTSLRLREGGITRTRYSERGELEFLFPKPLDGIPLYRGENRSTTHP